MPSFPNRCQHIKVNGTVCGSPAMRRNRFCYFHKRTHEERISLGTDRARRRPAAFVLPVLEDANSVQVALMQVLRLLALGQLDSKTAGLMLYALQTASSNLRHTRFEPFRHDVVLDPRKVDEVPLDSYVWEDEDFITEDEEEEEDDDAMAALASAEQKRAQQEKREIKGEVEAIRFYTERRARDPKKKIYINMKHYNVVATPVEPSQAPTTTQTAPTPPRRPPSGVDLTETRKEVQKIARDAIARMPKELVEKVQQEFKKEKNPPSEI